MVQYRKARVPRGSSASDYWKFASIDGTRSAMRMQIDPTGSKRFRMSSAASQATKARLKEIIQRTQQGLLIYETCTKIELKAFACQRGISTTATSKKDLIAVLETADGDATFDSFFKFPAEIRVLIYKINFASFVSIESPFFWAKPPPVTRVCSLMRHEALELFFATCEFRLEYYSVFASELDRRCQAFFQKPPACLLGAIRKLRLVGTIKDARTKWQWESWNIRIGTEHVPGALVYKGRRKNERNVAVVQTRLRAWLRAVGLRSGRVKLRKSDAGLIQKFFFMSTPK